MKRFSNNNLQDSFEGSKNSFKLNVAKARKDRHTSNILVSCERPKKINSLNSLSSDYSAIKEMVDKVINEHEIPMPPTKEGLRKLCEILNLAVSPVKIIDCMIFCKSAAKKPAGRKDLATGLMIEADWVYDTTKLVQWFQINIRTFRHLDESRIDKHWREEVEENVSAAHRTMRATAWKPHPQAYMRGRTGTGGTHINKIVKSRNGRLSTAFQEYGIGAETMASSFEN